MAETRTIRTVLELNAQRFNAGAASAAASAKGLAGELGKISDAQGKHRADYDRVANSLLGVGAAAATGLGLAAKASMDWESSWAGVLKTVDGTPQQLKAVEDGLRGLAKELPASHQEIAAVAEAAGQLGVQTDSVVEFTRTMINLGETTNLSAEEAATSLARFSNVMGTSQNDVDRLGAVLVGLGNNFETTESEIMAMGMRLSGIGSQLNMSEGEVLGLAAAMSSVGIEAEAGGTAMTQGMKKIDKAVREGGDSLTGFAEVAGMSNEEFAKLWSEDSAAGLEAFVHGLARVGEEGGDVSGVLSELGMKGIRESDTFLRLAANADGLSEALAQGNTEFERNVALIEEAGKRYETTESQLRIAKNSLVDAGIELGASVLPVLADVAGAVADVADWFGALPGPVQEAVVTLGAVAGASALLAGGLMKVIPAAGETIGAFKRLNSEAPGVASAMGKVGKAVGIATAAFTAVSLISAYGDSLTDFSIGANEAADAALRLADSSNPWQTVFKDMGFDMDLASASAGDLADNLDVLANGHWYEGISNAETGIRNAFGAGLATTEDLKARLDEVGQAIAGLAQTDLPAAQDAFTSLWQQAGGSESAGQDLLKLMPALRDELIAVANASDLATDDQTLLKIATGELTPVVNEATGAVEGYNVAQGDAEGATDEATGAVEDQVSALEELQNVLEETANALLGVRGSERDFYSSIDDANKLIEENGRVLKENGDLRDEHSEKGRASQAALDGIAESTLDLTGKMIDAGAEASELDAAMAEGRENFIRTAEAMGMGSDEAERLADELQLIPEYVETEVEVNTEQAITGARDVADVMLEVVAEPHTATIEADTDDAIRKTYGFGEVLDGATEDQLVIVDADTYYGEEQLRKFQMAVNDAGGTVDINGETMNAEEALSYLVGVINAGEGTVMIDGNPVDAIQALNWLSNTINNGKGTVTIDGDPSKANSATDSTKRRIDGTEGTVDIEGDNSGANSKTDAAKRKADGTKGTIDVDANTSSAESGINHTSRPRSSHINASASTSVAENALNYAARTRSVIFNARMGSIVGKAATMLGRADGGWLNEGLNAGGWVPGNYPGKGVDNVMWPVMAGAAGGRSLAMQPLAGTEFVVNGQSAQQWGPALEAINAGMQPSQLAQNVSASVDAGAIATAVASAVAGYQPIVQIGDRDFVGVMRRAERMGQR